MGNDGEFMSWLHMVEIYNYVYQPRFSLISLIRLSLSICIFLSPSFSLSFFLISLSSPLFIRTFPFDGPHSFPIQIYTFDKVIAVHYPGRSFMTVIYDYYYCAVMATAIAWLPHIEKPFLQERKLVEHYVTKVATSRASFLEVIYNSIKLHR